MTNKGQKREPRGHERERRVNYCFRMRYGSPSACSRISVENRGLYWAGNNREGEKINEYRLNRRIIWVLTPCVLTLGSFLMRILWEYEKLFSILVSRLERKKRTDPCLVGKTTQKKVMQTDMMTLFNVRHTHTTIFFCPLMAIESYIIIRKPYTLPAQI